MFRPNFHVSPALLRTIKRIAVLVHDLNRRQVQEPILAELQSESNVTSTYASTSIEGNPLALTEVRRILKNRPDHLQESEQEVINYNRVLVDLNQRQDTLFSSDLLLQIHTGIMLDLLPAHQIGTWRQEPVVIYNPQTGDLVYLPPDHQDVPALMDSLVQFVIDQRRELDPLLLAGIFHKQFVVVHPFIDGNGRTTRLATKLLLADMGLDLFHLLSFENFYNANVSRYFQAVGVFGKYYDLVHSLDFTPWLEYFADGILDELQRLEKSLDLAEARPDTRLLPHHLLILEHIDTHGFITDKDYAQLTDRAKATRSLDFRKLITLGLIERKGKGRGTYYRRV